MTDSEALTDQIQKLSTENDQLKQEVTTLKDKLVEAKRTTTTSHHFVKPVVSCTFRFYFF